MLRTKAHERKGLKLNFWKFVGSAIKSAASEILQESQNVQRLRVEYASYSDSRLISIVRGEGMFGNKVSEKTAAFAALKDRYGEEGVREKIRQRWILLRFRQRQQEQ